jgi:hypothetical protein
MQMQPLPLSLKVPALGLPLFSGASSSNRDACHLRNAVGSFDAVKPSGVHADSHGMIISEQQARLAAQFAEPPNGSTNGSRPDVSPDLMARILLEVESTPELRSERILEARQRLALDPPAPREIAEKIVARAICDGLR